MQTIFAKIIQREIPAYIVAEDVDHIAFLDIAPLQRGHTLVIPKRPVDYFFDLKDSEFQPLMCFTKKVAKSIEKVIPCRRIGMTVLGLEVPHAHIHLVPISQETDLNFCRSRLRLSRISMEKTAEAIKIAFGNCQDTVSP